MSVKHVHIHVYVNIGLESRTAFLLDGRGLSLPTRTLQVWMILIPHLALCCVTEDGILLSLVYYQNSCRRLEELESWRWECTAANWREETNIHPRTYFSCRIFESSACVILEPWAVPPANRLATRVRISSSGRICSFSRCTVWGLRPQLSHYCSRNGNRYTDLQSRFEKAEALRRVEIQAAL